MKLPLSEHKLLMAITWTDRGVGLCVVCIAVSVLLASRTAFIALFVASVLAIVRAVLDFLANLHEHREGNLSRGYLLFSFACHLLFLGLASFFAWVTFILVLATQ